ncbi:hypothetical protein LINGRAPRIM_LOCUS1771 [Linum grandiflorum]
MSSFHDILASLVRSHVLYINDNMRSSKHQAHYLEFIDRPILPAVRVDPVAFGKYGLNPCTLLANLGWKGRLQDGRFSTIIDGYRIVVTPHLLEVVLGLPPGGKQIFEETDLLRIKHSNPSFSGALPFGPAISYLLDALGLPLRSKYLLESPLDIFRPRHVLREVGWKPSQLVYGSGGELQSCNDLNASDDEIDTLADEMERSLQIQSALEAAANENFDD